MGSESGLGQKRSEVNGPRQVAGRRDPSRGAVLAHLALLTPVFGACESGATEGSVDDSDGSVSTLEVTPAAVHILGTSESLAVVHDLEARSDGTIWVLNSIAPFFVAFDSAGGILGAHGTQGGGPEEFRSPSAFVTGGIDDGVWVLDIRRHALVRISDPEAPWAEVPLPREAIPPGTVRGGMDLMSPVVRTARLGDEVILPRSMAGLEAGVNSMVAGMLRADLVGLGTEDGSVETVLSLGGVLEDPFVGFEATEGGFPLWKRLWAVCRNEEVRVFDRVRNQLRGFDRSGMELPAVDLPDEYRLDAVTPRQFAEVVFPLRQAEMTGGVGSRLSEVDSARLVTEMAASVQGTPAQLAAYLPVFSDFRCSPEGTMWLRPFDLDVGALSGGRSWLRITPTGNVGEILLPERFDAFRFSEDRVWGVQRDEFDVASIAWAALPRPLTESPEAGGEGGRVGAVIRAPRAGK